MIIDNVILSPVVTEKSVAKNEQGQYVFWVSKNASKIDIKNAFHVLYGRAVASVKISTLPKKTRLVGRGKVMTKRKEKRKAYITFVDSSPFELVMTK